MAGEQFTTAKNIPDLVGLEVALKYAAAGWPLLPLKRDKTPVTSHGSKDATTDQDAIREWWSTLAPEAMGIATGPRSGLFVIDVDKPKAGQPIDGEETLAALEAINGPLPVTVEQRTGGGGRQLFFAWPGDGQSVPNSAGTKLGPGIDVRGNGGYVVVPPSLHPSGHHYAWVPGKGLGEIPLAEAPNWLLDMARGKASHTTDQAAMPCASGQTAYGQRALAAELAMLAGTPEGQRNDQLNRSAFALGQLVAGGQLERTQVESGLLGVALAIGLGEQEARRTIQSGLEDGLKEPRALAQGGMEGDASGQTEEGKGAPGGKGKKDESQKDVLLAIAEGVGLFHTPDSQAYASVPVDQHLENHPVESKSFKRWLGKQYYNRTGKVASSQALLDALNTIAGKAVFAGVEREVFVRLGHHDGKVYLDLGRPDWAAVEVDAQGWRIVAQPPVAFRRPPGLLPLPVPQPPGDLGLLRGLVNLGSQENFILAVGWLVGSLHPHGPYLALALQGEQGSGKSLTARALRQIFDPSKGDLRTAPHDERDLMVAAINGWVVAFDNLSGVPTWLSDALCRISTGGALSARTLYSNDEETLLEAKRPLLLNGIAAVASRHDLVDRAIILSLPTLPEKERRSEDTIWGAFHQAHPHILAGLLDAVSAAIGNKGKVKLFTLPRMADAALWVSQAEEALPWEPGKFMAAYLANRGQAVEVSLEADQVAVAVMNLMKDRDSWQGTASELLEALSMRVGDRVLRSQTWPKAAHNLTGRLTRVATFLRQAAGLEIETGVRLHGGRRQILIRAVSRDSGGQGLGDGGDAGDAILPTYPKDHPGQHHLGTRPDVMEF